MLGIADITITTTFVVESLSMLSGLLCNLLLSRQQYHTKLAVLFGSLSLIISFVALIWQTLFDEIAVISGTLAALIFFVYLVYDSNLKINAESKGYMLNEFILAAMDVYFDVLIIMGQLLIYIFYTRLKVQRVCFCC